MLAPTLVCSLWAQGKCESYRLSLVGVFTGYMHGPGQAFVCSGIDASLSLDEDIRFLPCSDHGFCQWSPCAASHFDFQDIAPETPFECKLILIISVSITTEDNLEFNCTN